MSVPARAARRAPASTTVTVRVPGATDYWFSPSRVKAAEGDVVRFVFAPGANHAVVESRTDSACTPLQGGFISDRFDLRNWEGEETFEVTINTSHAVFFYCPLTKESQQPHCTLGMYGAINADENEYYTYSRSVQTLTALPEQPSLGLFVPTGTPTAIPSYRRGIDWPALVGIIIGASVLVLVFLILRCWALRRGSFVQNSLALVTRTHNRVWRVSRETETDPDGNAPPAYQVHKGYRSGRPSYS